MGEAGVDVLHPEFRTADGRDVVLPTGIAARVVRIELPTRGSRSARSAALSRTALAHPKPGTLYYVAHTRLLVYWGTTAKGTVVADPFHGTGTAALEGGRTTGAAPNALVVAVLGYQQESWQWVASQPWIDLASGSTFEVSPTCNSAAAVHAFRRAGHLPFVAAGNSYVETTALSPGGSPDVVRVGGVRADGSSALPGEGDDPTLYSGRAYDLGGLFRNRIPDGGTDGFRYATGTSGSSPQVAGRVAQVLSDVRAAVGDTGSGVRSGALVLAHRRPRSGPLADGTLTAEELLKVVLAVSRPKETTTVGRYAVEGYGWFSPQASRAAVAVLLGSVRAAPRPEDDTAYTAAIAARTALYTAKGCDVLPW